MEAMIKFAKIFCEEFKSSNLLGKITYISALVVGLVSIVLFLLP